MLQDTETTDSNDPPVNEKPHSSSDTNSDPSTTGQEGMPPSFESAQFPQPVTTEQIQQTKSRRFTKKRILKVLVIVLLIGFNGTAATATWYMDAHPKNKQIAYPDSQESLPIDNSIDVGQLSTVTENGTENNASISTDIPTKHYVSKSNSVEFDYPEDWRISASSDDSSIYINSAKFVYKESKDSEILAGTISINIAKQSELQQNSLIIGGLAENIISEQPMLLKYSNPTSIQRKETHLNIYKYGYGDDAHAAFVSGGVVYSVGEAISSRDISKVDPFITMDIQLLCGVTEDSRCHFYNPGPMNAALFDTVPALQNAKKIIESMRFNK